VVKLPRAGCACDLDFGLWRGEERGEDMELLGRTGGEARNVQFVHMASSLARGGVAVDDGSLLPLLPSGCF
jgi:hypothetical protein